MHFLEKLTRELWSNVVIHGQKENVQHQFLLNPQLPADTFNSAYAGGKLRIEAQNSLALTCAAHKLALAARSGYLSEQLGQSTPICPLRPLWLHSSCEIILDENFSLFVPRFLSSAAGAIELCGDLARWGYDALMLGKMGHVRDFVPGPSLTFEQIAPALDILRASGIALIVQMQGQWAEPCACWQSPFAPAYRNAVARLEAAIARPFYLFQEGNGGDRYRQKRQLHNMTDVDLAARELQWLQESVLKYAIPIYQLANSAAAASEQHAQGWKQIAMLLGPKTYLAFSARRGLPVEDYLPFHPLLDVLRRQPKPFSNRLLLMLNGGLIGQGQGLWPIDPVAQLKSFSFYFNCSLFAGAIALAHQISRPNSLLDLGLWLAAQIQWNPFSISQLAESWFSVYFRQMSLPENKKTLFKINKITLESSLLEVYGTDLPQGSTKVSSEELVGDLKKVLAEQERSAPAPDDTTAADLMWRTYLAMWICDLRHMLWRIKKSGHLAAADEKLLQLNEDERGFWIQKQGESTCCQLLLFQMHLPAQLKKLQALNKNGKNDASNIVLEILSGNNKCLTQDCQR